VNNPQPIGDPAVDPVMETNAVSASAMRRNAAATLAAPPALREEIDSAANDESKIPPFVEATAEPRPMIPGYEIHGELARGGMGAILLGRDTSLGRDLALKVLLTKVRDHPEVVRRFIEEAQITGQLQHPGIVPVHELGRAPDGRPYFSMKLIKGRTLAKLLKDRSNPGHELPRFVKIFEQVAQTVAYAHARGVIHRDLKPLNIMVGKFGEVQVMDWGLAKVVGASHTETLLYTARTAMPSPSESPADSHQTQAGTVLGTPAYMSPEQARGDVEQLDERGDVFALGSILCEILTGRAAYVGLEVHAVIEMARKGELNDALAALDRCGAEPDLIALAKKCLMVNPFDRPSDAGMVAKSVSEHLTGVQERLRQTEMEKSAAEARAVEARATLKAERRARQLALSLTAVMLVGLAGLGWFYWQGEQQRKRAEASERSAQQSLKEAHQNFDLALEANDATMKVVVEMDKFKNLNEVQKHLLSAAIPIFEQLGKQHSADPKLEQSRGLVCRRLGDWRERAGDNNGAIAAFEQMRNIFAELRDRDPANPSHRQHLATAYASLGRMRRKLNQRTEAVEDYRQALVLQDQLAAEMPDNAGLRLELADAHAYLGVLRADLGQPTTAEAEFRHALSIREQLALSHPKEEIFRQERAKGLIFLAWFLANQDQTSEAETKFRQALELRAELADEYPKNSQYRLELSQNFFILGRLLADLDQRSEAEDALRKAIAQQRQLVETDPSVLSSRQGIARSLSYLGRVLGVERSRSAEAEAEFREAARLQEKLISDFPFNPACRQDLASSRSQLGVLLCRLGRQSEARTACEQALSARKQLVEESPDYVAYAVDLAESHCHMGRLAQEEKQSESMRDWYSKAIETLQSPLEKRVQLFEVNRLRRYALLGRARALTQLGRHQDAQPDWDEAMRLIDVRAGRGDVLFETALVCAQAAASLKNEISWRDKYVKRAVQLLIKAEAGGYFKDRAAIAAFKGEASFAVLRGQPEFDKLIADLERP
jgi:serine/threonine protein kinase